MTGTPVSSDADAEHARLVRELQRRVDALQRADEKEFGLFTTRDWLVCIGAFVILPYLLYFWFWP